MRTFDVHTPNMVRTFICTGDEIDMCKKCKARFMCYTGELPKKFSTGNQYLYSKNIESNIFGKVRGLVQISEI